MSKISLKKASKGLNQFQIGGSMIATSDFGQPQISFFTPVVPSDKIHVKFNVEARFAPMVVPTFMNVHLYTRAFFVPMSAIWKSFEYYYSDVQDNTALKVIPNCTNKTFVDFIENPSNGLVIEITSYYQDGMSYDIFDNSKYYLFTEKGRLFMKLLHSLGYSINFSNSDVTPVNMLPLFAWLRVFYDYIYPSQYVQGLSLSRWFNITTSASYSDWQTNVGNFLIDIVNSLVIPFRQDYFTSAWKNLNAPGTSIQNISSPDNLSPLQSSDILCDTLTPHLSRSQADVVATPASTNFHTATSTFVSQQQLNILSRLYDFVTRNNIVGTRFADQIFARFGIGSRKSDKDMSMDIGRNMTPLKVADVTQMAQTAEGNLGELGGKMFVSPDGTINLCDFESEDFGFIICMSQIMPEVGYYQGRKRWTLYNSSRLDNFYYPEFDMQMRAIRNDELFADYHNSTDYTAGQSYGGNPSTAFGFAPNYSEYKKKHDYLIGDFRVPSLSKNMESYFLFRDLEKPSISHPLSLSAPFLLCQQHEFDKIFAQPYVVRMPISTIHGKGAYSDWEIISVNGKSLLIRDNSDSNHPIFYVIRCHYDRNRITNQYEVVPTPLLEVVKLDNFTLAQFIERLGYPYIVDCTSPDSMMIEFVLFGQQFITNSFAQDASGNFVSPLFAADSSLTATSLELHTDEFFLLYSDYIDHAYLHYEWDVLASRPMATIAEEFMIEDGGNKLSVDLLGNRD